MKKDYEIFKEFCEIVALLSSNNFIPLDIHFPRNQEKGNVWKCYFHDISLDYLVPIENGGQRSKGERYGIAITLIRLETKKYLLAVGFEIVHSILIAKKISSHSEIIWRLQVIIKTLKEMKSAYTFEYASDKLNKKNKKSILMKEVNSIDDLEDFTGDYPAMTIGTGKSKSKIDYFARGAYFHFNVPLRKVQIKDLKKESIAQLAVSMVTNGHFGQLQQCLFPEGDPYQRSDNPRRNLSRVAPEKICSLVFCESKIVDAAHILPHSIGGSDHHSNLLWLCKRHHSELESKIYKNSNIGELVNKNTHLVVNLKDITKTRLFCAGIYEKLWHKEIPKNQKAKGTLIANSSGKKFVIQGYDRNCKEWYGQAINSKGMAVGEELGFGQHEEFSFVQSTSTKNKIR